MLCVKAHLKASSKRALRVGPISKALVSSASRAPYARRFSAAFAVPGVAEELLALYDSRIGHSNYDPFCTQLEHGLQTMHRARECGADDVAQLQCFLHDIGHLVLDEHAGGEDFLVEDLMHEEVGADHLEMLGFSADFVMPIRLHVPAKRYLCATDSDYWAALSDGSKASLELQGGVMNPQEVKAFENEYGTAAQAAAALRRWEDEGKNLFCHGHRDKVTLDAETRQQIRGWIEDQL